jgi:hypothetical protein
MRLQSTGADEVFADTYSLAANRTYIKFNPTYKPSLTAGIEWIIEVPRLTDAVAVLDTQFGAVGSGAHGSHDTRLDIWLGTKSTAAL